MGNAAFQRNGGGAGATDEENSLATAVADAAARGARQAIIDAVHEAQQEGAVGGQEIDPEALVAAVLPLSRAQAAAAAGAKRGIDEMVRDLEPANRFPYDLKRLKVAAASAASAGVKAAVLMTGQQAMGEIDQDTAAAAAATGAWVTCFFSVQTGLVAAPNASKYTALLGPMFGGSFPTSAAAYHLLSTHSDIVKLCGFGGITLGVFVISSGLAAGFLGISPGSVCYTRFATLAALVIVLSLFSCALYTIFHSLVYKITCAIVCGVTIAIFMFLWLYFGW
ncbi:uncharacterized protein LOC133891139 [Phragmites australis]|uniref:uncharacterized protein LOC133891139 n=1 Tax=Phragmites australis TaxID=29695 RepID=UPI002D78C3EC|nr:uncharacterized protein LOC133891139 [Phragmites australis]